jgi:hypothetical protein
VALEENFKINKRAHGNLLRACCPNKKCLVEVILIFGLKLAEILSKQRGISVDANACFRKRY